jgi:hypothetical protein
MSDVRAIREKLFFEFGQYLRRRTGRLRQGLVKKLHQELRFHIREDRPLFDVVEILCQQIYDLMANLLKLASVHESP